MPHGGPGGDTHLIPAVLAQLGYVSSLIARGDLPPANPTRLVLLVLVWVGLAIGSATSQILLEVASLWIVKLRLQADSAKGGDIEASTAVGGDAPYIKTRRNSKSKSKPAAKAVRRSPRPKRGAARHFFGRLAACISQVSCLPNELCILNRICIGNIDGP